MLVFLGNLLLIFLGYKIIDWLIRLPVISRRAGSYILVTGCDTGFGQAAAKRFDELGCHVFATCMTKAGEADLRKSCSDRLKTIIMDVSDSQSVQQTYNFVKNELPTGYGLWGVINNAGTAGRVVGAIEWFTVQNYRDIADVNLYGVIDVTMTFLPLIKQTRGRIVNVASVHGRTSLPGNTAYSITKYGVEAFSDGLRRSLRPFGCTVHLIEPGFHQTNIINREDNERQLRTAWQQASPEIKEEYGSDYIEKVVESFVGKLIPMIAAKSIDGVINAYEHALFGQFPRARYVVGIDANYFWLPVQWLPEWLGDWLLEVLTPDAPVPAACLKQRGRQ